MLELFTIDKLTRSRQPTSENSRQISHGSSIVSVIIAIGAAILAYQCNLHKTPAARFIIVVLSFLFSGIYLIYYFIWHVLLGNDCEGGAPTKRKRKRK